ncbi:phosphotransferase, partial [Escherichia coli]
QSIHILRGVRQQQDEPGRFSICSRQAAVVHNLIFDEGKLIGCIDVGRVGIADRYQDLAILWNCLGEFSPSLQKRLFQKYGIDNPDMNKLQFHLMLDEFF